MSITEQMEQSSSWLSDFKIFAGSTTAHGVNQIFVGRNKFVRLLFLLAWIVCVLYSLYMIMTSILSFIDKPTGTKYEVITNDYSSTAPQTIKFPTITICSHNKVKKRFLKKKENAAIRHYWDQVDQYSTDDLGFNWKNPAMALIQNMTYEELLREGGPDDNRLLHCEQRLQMCQKVVDEYKLPYFVRDMSSTGNCWRVNPEGVLQGKSGDWGRMRIMMFADLKDYARRTADQPMYGFTVAFHDNTTFGSTLSSGYFMSPGSIYKVDLRLKKETREPPPGGHCNASLVHTTYGAYAEGSCVMECKDRWLNDSCGCVNIVPPLDNGTYRSCTLREWSECGLGAYLRFDKDYRNPNLAENICPCPAACKETHYDAQLSSSSLSPVFTENLYEMQGIKELLKHFSDPAVNLTYDSAEDIRNNVMVLEVLFTSMVTSEIRQIVTYTSANLLGDIGGVLGLFLGASVFTIIEFLQVAVFAVQKHCFGRWCGDGAEDKDKVGGSGAVAMSSVNTLKSSPCTRDGRYDDTPNAKMYMT